MLCVLLIVMLFIGIVDLISFSGNSKRVARRRYQFLQNIEKTNKKYNRKPDGITYTLEKGLKDSLRNARYETDNRTDMEKFIDRVETYHAMADDD